MLNSDAANYDFLVDKPTSKLYSLSDLNTKTGQPMQILMIMITNVPLFYKVISFKSLEAIGEALFHANNILHTSGKR